LKEHATNNELGSEAFGILMWFYQLAGIMLSVTSPLTYLDGSAVAYSIVSFFVNSKPSSDAAADVTTKTASSSANQGAASTKFQFCVDVSFSNSQVHVTTLLYYLMWACVMLALAQKVVWKIARKTVCSVICGLAQMFDVLSDSYQRVVHNSRLSGSFFATQRGQFAARQSIDIEIRGPVVLKWLVTCFSAVATLMMQGTACVRLDGLVDSNFFGNWIYDGRVSCFSNSGEAPGLWQVASVFGVALVIIAPAVLLQIMRRIAWTEKRFRTQLQETLLEAYSGSYAANACHWKVVM
jgi:hypothetical protein